MFYKLLTDEDVEFCRKHQAKRHFVDGKNTQKLSKFYDIKQNKETTICEAVHERVSDIFTQSPFTKSVYCPLEVRTQIYNRYTVGDFYDFHVDPFRSSNDNMRYNYGFSICLSNEYEGGEFVIRSDVGEFGHQLQAGEVVIFPVIYPHKVAPITSGIRECLIGWFSSNISYEQSYILRNVQEVARIHTTLVDNDPSELNKELLIKTALIQNYLTTEWGF